MFKNIYNFFKNKISKEKDRWAKINFLKYQQLPKYSSITGIELKWSVTVDREGPYDMYTGEALGETNVWVLQEPPTYGELSRDNRHYKYSVLTGALTVDEIFEWEFILNEKWDELCYEEGTIQLRHKENK